MTPDQFIAKWKVAELKEQAAAQSHFIDLCRMLDEPAPSDAEPTGEWYAFVSKKAQNHAHMMAVYFMHYNFVRIHQTLRSRQRWRPASLLRFGKCRIW